MFSDMYINVMSNVKEVYVMILQMNTRQHFSLKSPFQKGSEKLFTLFSALYLFKEYVVLIVYNITRISVSMSILYILMVNTHQYVNNFFICSIIIV